MIIWNPYFFQIIISFKYTFIIYNNNNKVFIWLTYYIIF